MKISKLNPSHSIALYAIIAALLILVYSIIFVFIARLENQPENADILTSIYWVVTTMTTVGYGDIVLTSNLGRGFSIFVQISGLTILFGMLFPFIIVPWLENTIKVSIPKKADSSLDNHIIICGYNNLVETLIEEFERHDYPYIIIDDDENVIRGLLEKNVPCIYGDIAAEGTFINANINSANFVIVNKSDELNANIILSIRGYKDLNIICLVENISNAKYLRYAGATRVLSPKSILGHFIGNKAVDPFVGTLSEATEIFDRIKILEFPVYPRSFLIGTSLKSSRISERTGVNVVGIWKGGDFILNPDPDDTIQENWVLLVVGTVEQLTKLKQFI
ncbi:MAG: potassium channel family protein [Methanohalobium sp.]|uniref:potassium channel family protein n=1 Tax=Methanohalobium sp. TaxID=2837493 RepID=UPI00397B2A16